MDYDRLGKQRVFISKTVATRHGPLLLYSDTKNLVRKYPKNTYRAKYCEQNWSEFPAIDANDIAQLTSTRYHKNRESRSSNVLSEALLPVAMGSTDRDYFNQPGSQASFYKTRLLSRNLSANNGTVHKSIGRGNMPPLLKSEERSKGLLGSFSTKKVQMPVAADLSICAYGRESGELFTLPEQQIPVMDRRNCIIASNSGRC